MIDSDVPATPPTDDLHRKAKSHLQSGEFAAAILVFEDLIRSDPQDVDALTGLASAFENQGMIVNAAKAYKGALSVDPSSFEALHKFGRLYLKMDKPDAATHLLRRALDSHPASHDAWCDLGSAQMAINEMKPAVKSYRKAIEINPASAIAHYNLAACLRDRGSARKALGVLKRASVLKPNSDNVIGLAATILSDMGMTEKALMQLDKQLASFPDSVECHQVRALVQLRAGQLEEGFQNYEWRLAPSPQSVSVRPFQQTRWKGEPDTSKTLLVWLEQGIGDEILSLNMLSDICRLVPNCIVECDGRLTSLIARSFPDVTVVARENPPAQIADRADLTCPMWSTAQYLRCHWSDFPAHAGYLKPDPDKVNTFREKYTRLAEGKRMIGFSWASGAKGGHFKTPPLDQWTPLFNRDDICFMSLQHAPDTADIEHFSSLGRADFHVDPEVNSAEDLESMAAQVAALSGVISISNSTAHMSGAIGVPTACVIPEGHGGFWFWHRHRSDSPWYPSMRLCRQSESGEWGSAIDKAADWLDEITS